MYSVFAFGVQLPFFDCVKSSVCCSSQFSSNHSANLFVFCLFFRVGEWRTHWSCLHRMWNDCKSTSSLNQQFLYDYRVSRTRMCFVRSCLPKIYSNYHFLYTTGPCSVYIRAKTMERERERARSQHALEQQHTRTWRKFELHIEGQKTKTAQIRFDGACVDWVPLQLMEKNRVLVYRQRYLMLNSFFTHSDISKKKSKFIFHPLQSGPE